MNSSWQSICINVGDAVFGWALELPRDIVVMLVGVVLGLVMYVVRRATTDPNDLRQITADERRLRNLIAQAKADGDRERVSRYRHIQNLVRGRRTRAELPAVCVSVVLLSAVIPWGQRRLEYLPVRVGEVVEFVAHTPSSMVGDLVHVVPQVGVTSRTGWIQVVSPNLDGKLPAGRAVWSLQVASTANPLVITLRLGNLSTEHPVDVNGSFYEVPVRHHNSLVSTEVVLRPYQPLGWIPRQILPSLAGWAVFMMIATALTYFGLRRVR